MPTSSPANLSPTPAQSLLQDLPPWVQSPWAIALIISFGVHGLLLAWISQPRRQNLIQQANPVKVVELPSSALGQLPTSVLGNSGIPGTAMLSKSPGTDPLLPLSPSIFSKLPSSTLPATPSPGLLSLQTLSLLPNLLPPPPPLGLEELPSRPASKPPEARRRPTLAIPAPPPSASSDDQQQPDSETKTDAQPEGQAQDSSTAEQQSAAVQSNGETAEPAAQTGELPASTTAAAPKPQLAYDAALTSSTEVAQQREAFLAEARQKLDQPELALPSARLQNLAASGPGCFASTAQPVEFMALVDGKGEPIIPITLVQSSGYPDLNKEAEGLMAQQSLPRPGQPYLLRVSLKFSPPKDCPSPAS